MTTSGSVSHDEREIRERAISERVARGADKYAMFSEEIKCVVPGLYMIPKSDEPGYYRTDIRDVAPTCECPDWRGHRLGVCKSIVCAMIAFAKQPRYHVQKATQGDVYELVESRAWHEEVIGWGALEHVYWMKWELEGMEAA